MPFERLPSWKEENPVTWEKQQITKEINKLIKLPDTDPSLIKALKDRYAVLDKPQQEKRQAALQDFLKRKGR